MPYSRKDKVQWQPGHYYHLYNRGARQLTIFREPANYEFVLRRVKKYLLQYDLTVIAFGYSCYCHFDDQREEKSPCY